MLQTASLVLMGLVGAYYLSKRLSVNTQLGVLLYVWHTLFVYVFQWYVIRHGGDAVDYFNRTIETNVGQPGSGFVLLIVSFMSKSLAFSFIDCSIFFGFVGYTALLLWLKQLLALASDSRLLKSVVFVLIFLPSFGFWSAGIGKDVFALLVMALVVRAVLEKELNHKLLLLAVLALALIRPHLALLIGILYLASCVFIELPSRTLKLFITLISMVIVAWSYEYFLKYIGFLNVDGEVVSKGGILGYFKYIASFNYVGASRVDLDSFGLPYLLFGYFLRPTVFEAQSALHWLVGIENAVLLILFVIFVLNISRVALLEIGYTRWVFLLTCFVMITFGYAMISSNLGIAERTKWMVVPLAFVLARLRPVRFLMP